MTLTRPEVYRQSHLRGFTICARRTRADLIAGDDSVRGWVGRAGDLGTAFHVFASVYLDTLKATGHGQMPTQEAIEVLYEVLPQLGFTLPFEQLDELRYLVLGFCDLLWNPKRLLAIEQRLEAEILCPDGEVRVLKGQPDVLMADPPNGLIVVDFKTGRGRPRGPRVEPEVGEVVEDRKYLSDMFQGDTYSLLALAHYPSAQHVIFRELHLRSGQIRQGRLSREQLEHVERKLAVTMMNLDRAIGEGEDSPLWAPRPGSHCARQCPVARSCPIPAEQRGDGALESPEEAHGAAEALGVLEGQRNALIGQLKAYVEDPSNPLPSVNEETVASWKPPTGKGRRFGLWPRADVIESSQESAA
jgi:hypothetical protein